MLLNEFEKGKSFWTGTGEWICTDIGTRTIAAVRKDDMIDQYGKVVEDPVSCSELIFHRYDWGGCWKTEEEYKEIMMREL